MENLTDLLQFPFISAGQLALVPLVMMLVSGLKGMGLTGENHRYAPGIALGLGLGGAFLLPSESVQFTILAGLVVGCVGAGLYSGVKTTFAASDQG